MSDCVSLQFQPDEIRGTIGDVLAVLHAIHKSEIGQIIALEAIDDCGPPAITLTIAVEDVNAAWTSLTNLVVGLMDCLIAVATKYGSCDDYIVLHNFNDECE